MVRIKGSRVKGQGVRKTEITPNLAVNIAGIEMKNPVMTASGTFGYGEEYSAYVDLNRLGAVVTKGLCKAKKRESSAAHLRDAF